MTCGDKLLATLLRSHCQVMVLEPFGHISWAYICVLVSGKLFDLEKKIPRHRASLVTRVTEKFPFQFVQKTAVLSPRVSFILMQMMTTLREKNAASNVYFSCVATIVDSN